MEQPFSTSKVTVEYFDPHDVYKLLAPGLIPRLPLRDLHWQSHAGPLRSIHTLHVDLVLAGAGSSSYLSPPLTTGLSNLPGSKPLVLQQSDIVGSHDDGFQTATISGRTGSAASASSEHLDSIGATLRGAGAGAGAQRRHQIPGLRRTPYLKVLLVRCDDNDAYKSTIRGEIREWIKSYAPSSQRKPTSTAENHDAFEWLIIHVVIPNTVAATQPRVTGSKAAADTGLDASATASAKGASAASRWRGGSSTLLEKMRSDFNSAGKGAGDRVAQIRIGINDVPYDILPRVVPAVPTGYHETEQDAEHAWTDLIAKFKGLILSSFDQRVSQYEEDIKERDGQRSLPGWNFCTFFILKEGLARGFESVGLVEDALVGYDELSVGLDTILHEQAGGGAAEAHGGALLAYTEELKELVQKAARQAAQGTMEFEEDEETVDLQQQSGRRDEARDRLDDIPISSTKKPYRDLILANNVSVFDFRCYVFARQTALLLRLGNAWSTREELLAKLREQQDSVLCGVAPRALPPKPTDESEDLAMLAEICKRALAFIPTVMSVMRNDMISALRSKTAIGGSDGQAADRLILDAVTAEVIENIVSSFAFSVAQQILAQTSTKALPIPPSTLLPTDSYEPKASIPDPKTMMHPARTSSLHGRAATRPPPSPNFFPSIGRRASVPEASGNAESHFLKAGLEELAARRAELHALSRSILEGAGGKRGWSNGWVSVPVVGEAEASEMEEISLDNDADTTAKAKASPQPFFASSPLMAGIGNELLRTALDNRDDFYRLYETLTDKALRHYTVANYTYAVQANMADLAVLKYHLNEFSDAAAYFYLTTPFFGESGWSLLELSMLVMYSRCLKELHRKDEYARVIIKLLSKAAAARKDKLAAAGTKQHEQQQYPEWTALAGFLADLLDVSKSLERDVKVQMTSFFADLEIDGTPIYDDGQDSYSLDLKLRSLFVDELEVQKASLRIVTPVVSGKKEIWLQNQGPIVIRPGKNRVRFRSSVFLVGAYEVDHIVFSSSNVSLHFEREPGQPADTEAPDSLGNPEVILVQRASSLDVQLLASKNVQLDKNSNLDLQVKTGWNTVTACEVKIRAGTGGMRILVAEATVLGAHQPARTPEGGTFVFGAIPAESTLTIRFPFTVEQDLLSVAIKVEVGYSTDRGDYSFLKTPSVPIALALGVNVQDIFKHAALFSRFTVSTASTSPLRLFRSELLGSELFDSGFGAPPTDSVTIFPKQPASLLYKITRKPECRITPKTKKTMYLKLYYSVLLDEIEALLEESLSSDLKNTPLREYSRLVVSSMLSQVQSRLSAYDLEKCALLGELAMSFLADVKWERQFGGLAGPGRDGGGEGDEATKLVAFMVSWQRKHPVLPVPSPPPSSDPAAMAVSRTILIPVDIPSVTIVHTVDIQLQEPILDMPTSVITSLDPGVPVACINQLVPATLHLKWTRIWDTGDTQPTSSAPDNSTHNTNKTGLSPALTEDLEFSYEVTAPSDNWLLGGRRKGHFVIPGASQEEGEDPGVGGFTSTPDTEADIPLLLVPLREGWLPYPSVEIREVRATTAATAAAAAATAPAEVDGASGHQARGHCEIDYRNLGETVRVIADRRQITLSLDASGPGGGPLVLESEQLGLGGKVVA